MITLITTIASFLTAGLPKVLDFFQDRSDKSHELALAGLQLEQQLKLAEYGLAAQERMEEIRTDQVALQAHADTMQALYAHDASLNEGTSTWVKNLRGSVRPIVTYIFVVELVLINLAGFMWAIGWIGSNPAQVDFGQALDLLFSTEEMTIVSSIIAFWFGSQAFGKK